MVSFDSKLHIASIESEDKWNNFNVLTITQSTKAPLPAIRAYLGARYSRSADSIKDIAKEVLDKRIDASARLEAIFHGYGHRSVGDMADIFVCIERIPIFFAQRTFNHNPVISGQERSTRFQNFQEPQFVKIPSSIKVSKTISEKYESIMKKALRFYREVLDPTREALKEYFNINEEDKIEAKSLQARTFDTARYFLPIGLETSFAVVMSARSWSEYISYLQGSPWVVDKRIGEMIFQLLTGEGFNDKEYVPEAMTLIRHVEPNTSRIDSSREIAEFLKETVNDNLLDYTEFNPSDRIDESFVLNYTEDPIRMMINHYAELFNDRIVLTDGVENVARQVGEFISKYHDHFSNPGTIAQTGSIMLNGWADYGVIKDLVRHRSFERFIPFYEVNFDYENILARKPEESFALCDYLYLDGLEDLQKEYRNKFTELYTDIFDWTREAAKEMDKVILSEYMRYLLPHGHLLRYNFYASFDDLLYTISLRTRPGGHIAYRQLTYKWLERLAEMSSVWDGLLEKIPVVDASSRDQFIKRS